MKYDKRKTIALGGFMIEAGNFVDSHIKGGNQKLSKLVGDGIYYQSENKKDWFFNVKKLRSMTAEQLEKLTEKVVGAMEKK